MKKLNDMAIPTAFSSEPGIWPIDQPNATMKARAASLAKNINTPINI